VQNLPKNQKFPPPRKIFPKISPSFFFEENPVFIFQLKEVLVGGGGGLDERIC
jgi:hypothetical protein